MIDKQLLVERRSSNSRRIHFNRAGDWRPRLVIWPEYDGLDVDSLEEGVEEEVSESIRGDWGRIIAGALTAFAASSGSEIVAYNQVQGGLWSRLTRGDSGPAWSRDWSIRLDEEYVSRRQSEGHDSPVFLICPGGSASSLPERIQAPILDRAMLLPLGTAIFELGIEEPVLEIAMAGEEDSFIDTLTRIAAESGHRTIRTERHFVSHWVKANKERFGAGWDEF